MAKSAWPVLLLTAPILLGLAAAYPQRGYRDELDSTASEKNVRHIDGLGAGLQTPDPSKQLQDLIREVDQSSGTGSAGKWTMHKKYSEYSSSSGAPVRATITGEAIEGTDGILGLTTNCHNCRMRIRKVGGGALTEQQQSALAADGGATTAGVGAGSVQVESSRYYSSRSEAASSGSGAGGNFGSGYSSSQVPSNVGSDRGNYYGGVRPVDLTGGVGGASSSSSRTVKTSRVVQQSGSYGAGVDSSSTGGSADRYVKLSDLGITSGASSPVSSSGLTRKETKVTRSSWNLSDLGYGTSNIEDIIRRLDADMRAGRFENGKTVTTVTTTMSENGGPPVTRKETFVKDGFDVPLTSDVVSGNPTLAGSASILGQSEIQDLLSKLREDLRSGKTEAGKTVTTIVESTSIDGGPPVVKKQTFVKDGFDASTLEGFGVNGGGMDGADASSSYGSGQEVLQTTHTRKEYRTSVHGGGSGGTIRPNMGPVDHLGGGNLVRNSHRSTNVNSVSYGSASGTVGSVDSQAAYDHNTRRLGSLGQGQLTQEAIPTGFEGGRRPSNLPTDSVTSGYGSSSASSYHQETRRVDRVGEVSQIGGTQIGPQASQAPLPSSENLGVAQMKGYRREDSPDDASGTEGASSFGRSKYYSTFESSSYQGGVGGARDQQGSNGAPSGSSIPLTGYGHSSGSGYAGSTTNPSTASSSSSYRKVVHYSSSGNSDLAGTGGGEAVGLGNAGRERDVDHLGGGHLIRGAPSTTNTGHSASSYGQQVSQYVQPATVLRPGNANQAFINAEQGSGRIPEAASGSYFSSSSGAYQRASSSDMNSVNPAAPLGPSVVPVHAPASSIASGDASAGVITKGSSSSYSRKVEWSGSSVRDTENTDSPPNGQPAPSSPSIKLGYGTGNGGYGGPARYPAQVSGAGEQTFSSAARGGRLTTSVLDLGVIPPSDSNGASGLSSGSRAIGHGGSASSSYGARASLASEGYSSSSYGSRHLTQETQQAVPSSYSAASSWSSYSSSGAAVPPTSTYGLKSSSGYASGSESLRQQRMTSQGQTADCLH